MEGDDIAAMKTRSRTTPSRTAAAFTLMEVIVAMGIFFMAMFAILALLSNTLRNARALQRPIVDAAIPAGELSLTNRLAEGSDAGDFGDLYPDHRWSYEIYEAATNGLFQVDFTVTGTLSGNHSETRMSILLFRPESQAGGMPASPFRPPAR
jgi:hypothetical protein